MKLCQLHTLAEMAGQKWQQAERSKGSEKKSVEKMAENEVDRILIFLDPAQEIPEGAYDPQLQ